MELEAAALIPWCTFTPPPSAPSRLLTSGTAEAVSETPPSSQLSALLAGCAKNVTFSYFSVPRCAGARPLLGF